MASHSELIGIMGEALPTEQAQARRRDQVSLPGLEKRHDTDVVCDRRTEGSNDDPRPAREKQSHISSRLQRSQRPDSHYIPKHAKIHTRVSGSRSRIVPMRVRSTEAKSYGMMSL